MEYPWFKIVNGDDIEQGDIMENCPVFQFPPEFSSELLEDPTQSYDLGFKRYDTIVLSQTCDMVQGREKINDVLLCSIWNRSDYKEGHFSKPEGWEEARKGRCPAYHILNHYESEQFNREFRVVDFKRIYSLPLDFLRNYAKSTGDRLRLLPPYREHLSQAFARFFMRVGLPVDIPPFK